MFIKGVMQFFLISNQLFCNAVMSILKQADIALSQVL